MTDQRMAIDHKVFEACMRALDLRDAMSLAGPAFTFNSYLMLRHAIEELTDARDKWEARHGETQMRKAG